MDTYGYPCGKAGFFSFSEKIPKPSSLVEFNSH